MTTQQSIPFKLRKKTHVKYKEIDENDDVSNIMNGAVKQKQLKRHIKDDIKKDDSSSAMKVSKRYINSKEITQSETNSDKIIARPLTSREKEIEWLENFLTEHADNETSASLYISGQPGTGKTACLSHILHLPKIKDCYKQVYVNCTMMKSATSIYARICKELEIRVSATTETACYTAIEKFLNKKHKMVLLVLDEIDQLESKRQSVLYTIFEWPALPNSRLVLVGIANALDLTERALPRLQARCSLRPQTLHFAPYTKEQIIKIFTTVLATEDKTNVFSPVALQMLAAKIAAVSGDMRRALDIGRRVIELAKRSNFSNNQSLDNMIKDKTVTVELKEVLQVLNDVYGGSRKIDDEVDEGFPMQQKLILCSLMLMLTKGNNKDIVMGKLFDVYKKVAEARNIGALDMSEMLSACSLLESRGAIRIATGGGGGAGGGRARKLRLLWDEADLVAALRDKPLLSAILSDLSSLPSAH